MISKELQIYANIRFYTSHIWTCSDYNKETIEEPVP